MGSRINEIKFINEDDQALLITGSSDGVIKVYRNYESDRNVEVVSAWRALTDLVPSNVNAGLAFDWQQGQGKLLVAGDVKVIRVWNAATEICTNVEKPTNPPPKHNHQFSFFAQQYQLNLTLKLNIGHPSSFWFLHYVSHL
jgi:WD40 repeat protein